jgi:hypothetical protein
MGLSMSMFATREHYLDAKCKQQEAAISELAKYFTSGNNVPVERATIMAKDFWRITGLTAEELGKPAK